MPQKKTPTDVREAIAAVISSAIVLASICYWIVQIDGVRAMLKIAYG
jgi:hypothetical protein